MKKIILTFTVLLLSVLAINAYCQVTGEQIKAELTNKEWKIVKYETFGVSEAPRPEQANDKIYLNADMTFTIVENGKEYKGKWTILNPSNYFSCKSADGTWNNIYKVISTGEKSAVIEFKDPDLIKTKYYLELK